MYRIGVELKSVQDLELPGTGQVTLRHARVPEDTDLGVLREPAQKESAGTSEAPVPDQQTAPADTADGATAPDDL
ncbi:hypothetical protein D3C86_2224350 [compost metagenome]